MNYNMKLDDNTCRVGEVRFSYAHVLAPKEDLNGKLKYSVCLLIPKENKAAVTMLQNCINAARDMGKTKLWGGKVPVNCKGLELRDGDIEKDDESYAGCWFINASANTDHKPYVKVRDESGEKYDALDDEDFYSGCYGAAIVRFYPYDNGGAKGVACGLTGVIKTRDGEKFSGGISADTAFADL